MVTAQAPGAAVNRWAEAPGLYLERSPLLSAHHPPGIWRLGWRSRDRRAQVQVFPSPLRPRGPRLPPVLSCRRHAPPGGSRLPKSPSHVPTFISLGRTVSHGHSSLQSKLGKSVSSYPKEKQDGTSPAVQWLGLGASTAEDPVSSPGQGTKVLQTAWCS